MQTPRSEDPSRQVTGRPLLSRLGLKTLYVPLVGEIPFLTLYITIYIYCIHCIQYIYKITKFFCVNHPVSSH